MQKLKWRQDAKKVLILVGSSPPHQQDNAAIRQLVADWRAQGGVVSTIDVSRQLHEEHERKLHRWLYGEELKEVPPLPDFYAAVKDSYSEISKEGGGDFIALGEDAGAGAQRPRAHLRSAMAEGPRQSRSRTVTPRS